MRRLGTELLPRRGPAKLLGYAAAAWLASAVFHYLVFVFSDTAWSGATSWRKPVVFSLSIGLLLWAFGWILDRLPGRPRLAGSLAWLFTVSASGEVGLIVLQQWRGRASHFNSSTPQDSLIFILMGVLVGLMSLALIALLIWSLIQRPTDPVERIAIIGGLALVVSGLGLGQWLISLGNSYVEQFDRVPETLIQGEAGVAKFPHAVAFHGIQVYMVAAALLRQSVIGTVARTRAMWITVLAYSGVMVFSAIQSFGGRAPFDLNLVSGPLLAVSGAALFGALGMMAFRWWTSPAPPVPNSTDVSTDVSTAVVVDRR